MIQLSRPIGVFDITRECPLRCQHCYYYTDVSRIPADLDESTFLGRLKEKKDQLGIRSAFWIGGEPLLRPHLLRKAMDMFPRNAVATSGAVPVPSDLDAGLIVSIDGPREVHDTLRGDGAFDLALRNTKHLADKSFALNTTLTTLSSDAISALPELVEQTRALGVLIGFHVGRKNDPLRLDAERRDKAVDELLALKRKQSGVLLNSAMAIERFRSSHSREVRRGCIYNELAVAFDVQFQIKRPCTFAQNAACDACGCPVVVAHAAWQAGDDASEDLLHTLFPRSTTRREYEYHTD